MIRHFAIATMLFALVMPAFADGPATEDEIAALEAQMGDLKKCLTPAQIAARNAEMLIELIDEVAVAVAEPTVSAEPAAITPAPAMPEDEPVDYC